MAEELVDDLYGKDWVTFEDGTGKSHVITMNISEHDMELLEFIGPIFTTERPKFWHYTRERINEPIEISMPVQDDAVVIPSAPLIVLVGGWLAKHDGPSTKFIKDALLNINKIVNVVTVDWYKFQDDNYLVSSKVTLYVAGHVTNFVKQVSKVCKVAESDIHLIGFSLGAHVVGQAGEALNAEGITIGRVTGLDPARPFFENPQRYPGLNQEAAAFVDVIHTSAGLLGISNPVGHASFYPGGGRKQPVLCPESRHSDMGVCEHRAAYKYFVKSVTHKFEAKLCPNYEDFKSGKCDQNEMQYMGFPCDSKARGKYFLDVDFIGP